MAYEKQTWNTGDVITAQKLNHMEDGIAGGTPMMSVTHAELLAIRNAGTLIPGMQYRITDYVCTTTQDESESRAVSHPFDIIVTADDTGMLNENARAVKKDGDTYYQYADLSAWELKYCLDNDGDRFKWADTTNGHGVVYYMKDDHNNECPYDFKQIQFKRYPITKCAVSSLVGKYAAAQLEKVITGIDEQNPVWCYTFSYDPDKTGVMSDSSVMESNVNISGNIINASYNYQNPEVGLKAIYLNNIVFIGSNCNFNTFGNFCYSNTFGNACNSNTFGNFCYSNTFGNACNSNTFGNFCNSNTFRDSCYSNTFRDNCNSNTFRDSCYSNTFRDNCNFNTFRDSCYSNTFGDNCNSNTFGDFCYSNTFGNACYSNTFGESCDSNTFGNVCYSNTFGDNCNSNTFGIFCNSNTFGNFCYYIDISAGTKSQQKQFYHVLDRVQGTKSSPISITGANGNNFVTYVGMNSSGTLKTWVPADLVQ